MPGKPPVTPPRHNPVAKFAHLGNKSLVFRERTRYVRAAKHKGRGPGSTARDA